MTVRFFEAVGDQALIRAILRTRERSCSYNIYGNIDIIYSKPPFIVLKRGLPLCGPRVLPARPRLLRPVPLPPGAAPAGGKRKWELGRSGNCSSSRRQPEKHRRGARGSGGRRGGGGGGGGCQSKGGVGSGEPLRTPIPAVGEPRRGRPALLGGFGLRLQPQARVGTGLLTGPELPEEAGARWPQHGSRCW